VAVIHLDRPKMNVLSREMQEEIAKTVREMDSNDEVRTIVFYGGEKNFAAGADVKEMIHWDSATAHKEAPGLQTAFNAVASVSKPTIAAITGYALGGGFELAMACDLRIAATSSTVGQPEILLGIIPGAGGTQRLTRLIGVARAKDIIMTGRFVAADEALSLGMVNEVVADDKVLDRALELASSLANGPAQALAAAKRAIEQGSEVSLADGLKIESQEFANLFGTPDQVSGMTSFVENGPGKATFQ
jgi:enoyl-CoA hydratase